jgi:hypothetical protein
MTTNRRHELARRGICPDCDDEYKRLAIHWRGPCSPPALQSARLNLITGFLLGGGRVGGNGVKKHFQVTTQWRPFAFWVFNQLGWLGATVVRKNPPRNDDNDSRPPAQHYEVRTHAHLDLNQFRAWYPSTYEDETEQSKAETGDDHVTESHESNCRTIPSPEDLPAGRLTQRAGRAWHAVAGRISWGNAEYATTRQARFSAQDDTRAKGIMRLLESVGLAPVRVGRSVQLPPKQVTAWLDWIGEPVPGVAYKWAATPDEYTDLKRDAEALRSRLWYHPEMEL